MRTKYNNGDDIGLQACGCDGCSPSMINGMLCHETGCPESWKDYKRKCNWCGQEFLPEEQYQDCCDEICSQAYHN